VVQALAGARTATRLGAEDVRGVMAEAPGIGKDVLHQRFMGMLGRYESRSQLVILECERSQAAAWVDFCLRQADSILVLADEREIGTVGTQAQWWNDAKLGERASHVVLAIVHPRADSLPRGGAAHARLPGVSRLFHVRSGLAADAGRLSRWLLARSVGLVLGGGGALGIAHVGVLKALEEARVPVDMVGGTSMGAIFAGGLARGWSADEIMDHVRKIFASPFALYDPTFPFGSLLAGKKLDRVMEDLFGDIDIADLWTPFFCVSTNISRAHGEVHDMGSLREAIRSSCSIPGLFPPYQWLKQLLVDGGLIDNLPIDIMAEICRGPVIAVDVFPYQRNHRREAGDFRWRRVADLASKLFSRAGPWIFDVLVHATLAGSQRTTEQSLTRHPPALYLTPELTRYRLLDWRAHEALFRAGYTTAKREIESGALPRRLWEGHIEGPAS
jgi:predicted acylesterase/phospholipase RssA